MKWIARSTASHAKDDDMALNILLEEAEFKTHSQAYREAVLDGLAEAFQGIRKAPKTFEWHVFAKAVSRPETKARINELNILFGDGRALDEVKKTALNAKADLLSRQAALKSLIDARPDYLREVCESLLEVRGMSAAAVRGLALFDDPAIAKKLVQSFRKLQPADRSAVLDTLTSRASYAKALLDNVGDGKGQIPRTDITAFHARQIRSLNNEALTKQLSEVWGELRESSADKQKLIADLKAKLTHDELAKANLGVGRILFTAVCSSCHTLYGVGGKIGPDLTGSGRANLDYLLENIGDPSAVVSADFRMSVLTLKDGRVLSGIVSGDDGRVVKLRTLTEEVTMETGEIVKRDVSPLSMMPDGLLLALPPEQVRDLIAYLMHPVQVELPK
jgi:putative heme-binding domain-containing protein